MCFQMMSTLARKDSAACCATKLDPSCSSHFTQPALKLNQAPSIMHSSIADTCLSQRSIKAYAEQVRVSPFSGNSSPSN